MNLETFVSAFNYSLLTLSIQPQAENATIIPGKLFSPKNRVRAIPPSELLSEDIQREITQAQANGCAVYFMVNEGNGIPAEPEVGNLNCGRRTNVTTLKALFIDTDEADSSALMEVLASIKLLPHFIIETSPKKYHFYFLIKPVPAEGINIQKWKAVQRKLASLVPNLDQSMADINQVLRLPYYYNLKQKPFHKINIIRHSTPDLYDLDFLYDRLGCHEFDELLHSNNGVGNLNGYHKFTYPEQPHSILPGNRRQSICQFIESILENDVELHARDEVYFTLIDAYILKYIKPQDQADFLPGGKRRHNIETYFHDQRNRRISLKHQKETELANQKFNHIQSLEDRSLPDSFYLNFPGDLGFLTRIFHHYAPKISLEMHFALAIMVSGALKADTFRYKGSWPLINGIIIAGTGAGKSVLKSILQEVLFKAGMSGPFSQLIDFQNTVQSLHEKLYSAGGVGTTTIDEAGDYLQILNSKNAPGYVKALRKYFKEASTGRGKGTRLSPGGSMSFKIPPISYGMLSIWAFIQPGKFEQSLSIDDMGDGFLPRFFIFNGQSNIDLLSTYQENANYESFDCPLDLIVWIESLAALSPYISGQSIKDTLECAEKSLLERSPKAKLADIIAAQRDAIYELRTEARLSGKKVNVVLDEEADHAVKAYLYERQQAALKLHKTDSSNPELAIYIRMEEMLNRLICCAAPLSGCVGIELAQHCIRYHRYQTDSFFAIQLPELSKTDNEKELEQVLKGVKRAFKRHREGVTLKDIKDALYVTHRPKSLTLALKELVNRGDIWIQERDHKRIKTRKISVYIPAIEEDAL